MWAFGRKITALAVAGSMCVVPTAAIGASRPAAAAPAPVAVAPASPWVALSAMTASSSAASAAAAQDIDEGPGFPPIAPLLVIVATIAAAIYIATRNDDHGHVHFVIPVSPD